MYRLWLSRYVLLSATTSPSYCCRAVCGKPALSIIDIPLLSFQLGRSTQCLPLKRTPTVG